MTDMETKIPDGIHDDDTVVGGEITHDPVISRGHAWLAGVLGAAVSLSLGEIFDRVSTSLTSLVIGMFDLLVDITPGGIVQTSINLLGTLQKPLLVSGIVVGSLVIGGALGVAGRKNPAAVFGGFLLFGVLGGFATSRSDLTSAGASWVTALVAAAVGAIVVAGLLVASRRPVAANDSSQPVVTGGIDRRTVLFGGAAAGAVTLTAAARVGRTSQAEDARNEILNTAASSGGSSQQVQLTSVPGAFDNVPGITQFTTPISPEDEFYLIDTAFRKPDVDPATWTLTIDGPYVDNPTSWTYQELLDREHVTTAVTLSCVSNPVGGDLVGNAVWTGIPLTELLDEAGIQDPTNFEHQIFSRSVDGFTCGFQVPMAYDGRTAMVALMMNGEPLPIDHGFPARLVIAGLYGYVSATKWLEEIQVTDWVGVDGFWMPRGWSKDGPIKTQSRIDTPTQGGEQASGALTIAGIAWNPTIGISQVEVGVTNADTQDSTEWLVAELAETESDETWVQWQLEWDAPPGDWFLQCRATDKTGFTQSAEVVAPAPNGAEGYHTIIVRNVA